jgi:hypothetical protein
MSLSIRRRTVQRTARKSWTTSAGPMKRTEQVSSADSLCGAPISRSRPPSCSLGPLSALRVPCSPRASGGRPPVCAKATGSVSSRASAHSTSSRSRLTVTRSAQATQSATNRPSGSETTSGTRTPAFTEDNAPVR